MPEKMSTSSQNNGKKSSNSSIVNTPSSTPLTSIANGNTQANTQSSPPPNNNAPKYGTLVPNRIFVGGISANTTEGELMQLFSSYGTVKAAKIIQDRAGVSKGYGFITFESEDDAKRPLREAENIVLRERKLNIAPAIKKQPFSRTFDASSPPAVAAGNPAQFFFPPGAAMPYFQGGVAYYPQPAPAAPGDPGTQQPVYQPPPVYPTQTGPPQTATYPSMMFPTQTIYMPQQYPMPMPYDYNYYQGNGGPQPGQYLVGNQGGPGGPQCAPLPPSGSPPRPPCYSQQMPLYSAADPMFYNMSVGTPMEIPPVYTEAFELGASGPYSEDTYNTVADHITQDLDLPLSLPPFITPTTAEASQNINNNNNGHHHNPHQHPPLPPSLPQFHTTDNPTTDRPSSRPQSAPNNNNNNVPRSEERNSNTPVVSLLSIDQQQEKDYMSMRGGRRRKPAGPPTALNNLRTPQGFIPPGYIGPLHTYGLGYPSYGSSYTNGSGCRGANGFDRFNKGGRGKARSFGKRPNDASSRSSLRTDSNSSASCVDEDKSRGATVNTPPLPANTQHLKILHNTASREFHNVTRYPNFRPPFHNNNNNVVVVDKSSKFNSDASNTKTAVTNSVSPPCPVSQVHVSTSQSFAPQARRSRRSIRRGGPSGVSEIGAGDAPLPNDDVCKKFETLKL